MSMFVLEFSAGQPMLNRNEPVTGAGFWWFDNAELVWVPLVVIWVDGENCGTRTAYLADSADVLMTFTRDELAGPTIAVGRAAPPMAPTVFMLTDSRDRIAQFGRVGIGCGSLAAVPTYGVATFGSVRTDMSMTIEERFTLVPVGDHFRPPDDDLTVDRITRAEIGSFWRLPETAHPFKPHRHSRLAVLIDRSETVIVVKVYWERTSGVIEIRLPKVLWGWLQPATPEDKFQPGDLVCDSESRVRVVTRTFVPRPTERLLTPDPAWARTFRYDAVLSLHPLNG